MRFEGHDPASGGPQAGRSSGSPSRSWGRRLPEVLKKKSKLKNLNFKIQMTKWQILPIKWFTF